MDVASQKFEGKKEGSGPQAASGIEKGDGLNFFFEERQAGAEVARGNEAGIQNISIDFCEVETVFRAETDAVIAVKVC